MTTLSEIGTHVRSQRKRHKLYITKMAENSGVHRNTLSDLEGGTGNIGLNTLISVCDQLNLDVRLVPKEYASAFNEEGDVDLGKLQALVAQAGAPEAGAAGQPQQEASPASRVPPDGHYLVSDGKIRKDDMVWNESDCQWQPAAEVPGAQNDEVQAYFSVARPL